MVDRNLAAVVLMLMLLLAHKTESLTLQIEGNKTSFTFPLGVVSEIKFYVRHGQDFRIYVLHKATEKNEYDTKCIVSESASQVCRTNNNICRCPNDTDGAFSLNKTFRQTDAGLWMFKDWQHDDTSKTVNVTISEQVTTWATQSNIETTPELAMSHLVSGAANSPITSQTSLTTTRRVSSDLSSSTLTTVRDTTTVDRIQLLDSKQNHRKPELKSSDIVSMVAVFVFTLVIIITLALDIFLWLNPEVDLLERCR